MGRFSDIRRGGELKLKLDAYTNYLQNPPAPRLNSRGDRAPSKQVFLNPFGMDLATDEIVAVNANSDGYTKLAASVNLPATGALVAETSGTSTIRSLGRFRPAKVSTFENATKTKTTPNSRFTGRPYLKYTGEGFSCPFGRRNADDDINDCFGEIKKILRARQNLQVNRVSLTPERIFAS